MDDDPSGGVARPRVSEAVPGYNGMSRRMPCGAEPTGGTPTSGHVTCRLRLVAGDLTMSQVIHD